MARGKSVTDGQYNVWFGIVDDGGNTASFDAKVEFYRFDEDYGNGYYMGIESPCEPFGKQGYDLRYNLSFSPNQKIPFIVQFFADRYDGKDGAWKLTGIRVFEKEVWS